MFTVRLGDIVCYGRQHKWGRCSEPDENAAAEVYYVKKASRDRSAREEYLKNVRKNPGNNDLFMIDIMREGIKDGDPRLL